MLPWQPGLKSEKDFLLPHERTAAFEQTCAHMRTCTHRRLVTWYKRKMSCSVCFDLVERFHIPPLSVFTALQLNVTRWIDDRRVKVAKSRCFWMITLGLWIRMEQERKSSNFLFLISFSDYCSFCVWLICHKQSRQSSSGRRQKWQKA